MKKLLIVLGLLGTLGAPALARFESRYGAEKIVKKRYEGCNVTEYKIDSQGQRYRVVIFDSEKLANDMFERELDEAESLDLEIIDFDNILMTKTVLVRNKKDELVRVSKTLNKMVYTIVDLSKGGDKTIEKFADYVELNVDDSHAKVDIMKAVIDYNMSKI